MTTTTTEAADKSSLSRGGVFSRARAAMPTLVPSDRRVVETVLSSPELVPDYTVSELAAHIGVAASTVVRACQTLGYKGFQDLKLALVRDLAVHGVEDAALIHAEGITSTTPPTEVVRAVLELSARTLGSAMGTVDGEAFAAAVDVLDRASRVLVLGNGTSSAPAQDAAYRLATLGLNASAPVDSIAQHVAAKQLDGNAVCLVISHTGATRETLTAATAAKARNAYLVAVTSFTRSPLVEIADSALVAGGPERGFRLESMASRLAHLALVDALFVGVAVSRPKRSSAALDSMADVTAEHTL